MQAQHLAIFNEIEAEKEGQPSSSSSSKQNIKPNFKSQTNQSNNSSQLIPTSTAHDQSYIENKDPALVQYWTAVIILALFATISFAVILATWRKIRPFSRSLISSNGRQNDRGNGVQAGNRDMLYSSEIIKSQPVDPKEFQPTQL